MADLVNEMLDKFMALSQEEKQISADMDAAFKEYNDYCSSSDEDLSKKVDEIRAKMSKLDYLMEYAREHAQPDGLEEAAAPFETSDGQLESIRQTIKLESHNDPNAESLYTKATGQKLFYEQKIEQTRQLIEGSKVQAKRQYDSDVAAINDRKEQHDARVKAYIQSDDFKEYLKLLVFDKSAFNSPGTANLAPDAAISIGQRRVKLSVPMELETELSAISNGEYNAAARTIGAPYQVSMKKGGVLFLDYDERNKAYLLGGIQRLLLNIIKYYGQNISDMLFCETETFNADSLGHIAALGKGIDPFICVPQSMSDSAEKLAEFAKKAEESPSEFGVSRVLVLYGFPENFMDDALRNAAMICRNAEKNGVFVIAAHKTPADETPAEREIRALSSASVRSRNGSFWIEETHESLFWYSAPSDLPEEIRRVYVEQRRQQAAAHSTQPAQSIQHEEPVPVTVGAPEPVPAAQAVPEPETPVHIEQPAAPSASAPVQTAAPVAEPTAPPVHEEVREPVHEPMPEPAHIAPAPPPIRAPRTASMGSKGTRALPEVKVGMSVAGNAVNIDLGGNITFVCGKRGGDREMLTDRIITQIIACAHPDDAELWLFDCGGGELMKYTAGSAPHIKYDVADSDDETVFDLIDVISAELEKRTVVFGKRGWADYSKVPADVYMPRIFVAINEFSELVESIGAAPRYFGRNYTMKLSKLFGRGSNYGIHFLLTSETFYEGGKRPACFEGCSIHCAAAVAGCDNGVKEMFGHIKLYENEIESLKKVPEGCAFTATEGGSDGLIMVRILNAQQPLDKRYTAVSEYTGNAAEYLDKHPFISDRKLRVQRGDRSAARMELINSRSGETLLFLGEPCRFRAEYPVRLYDEFGENVLVIAPEREKGGAAQMVKAALQSLSEQGIAAEILAWRSNPVYAELSSSGALDGVTVLEGEEAVIRVKEIAEDVAGGKHISAFEIVLGGDVLLAEMHAEDGLSGLKRVLVKGSRLGAHFMFVSGSVAQFGSGFISLFRHKIVFSCPLAEAEKILRDPSDCDLPENGFRLSNDYDELTMLPYSM